MNPSNYVKNVGRSFGYIGYDVFKAFNPNLAGMMADTKDVAKDIRDSVRDMKSTAGQKLGEMDLKNSARNYGKDTWANFKSDLKSGNFYNKGRQDAAQDEAFKSMFDGEDFDFDFDFGDDDDFSFDDNDDFGDGTNESEPSTADVIAETSRNQISASTANAGFIAETISKTQEHSTKKLLAGNVASTEYLATVQKQTAGTICSVVERSSASIVNQLANISMGVSAIAQLSEPMAVHFQNASTYYTKSTELQNKMVEYLEKLVENTSPTDTRFKSNTKYTTIDDLVGLSGFDIKAYVDMLKENAKNMKESVAPMLDMVKMMGGGGPGGGFKASPISSLLTMGMKAMTPKETKKAMEDFNNFLPNFFKSLIGGMEDKDLGLIGNMVKEFFLPKNRFTDKLDPSNYNKGKVDWNGKDQKALTEVIPYQLSLLVSAITGEDQKIFDYDSGKWKRVAAVKNQWSEMKLKHGINAGGDYRTFLNDTLDKMSGDGEGQISQAQRELMRREIDSYFQSTIKERDDRFRNINDEDFDYNKSGMSKETWEFMRALNKSIGEQNTLFAQFVGDVYSSRNEYGKKIREMSESGESVFNALFNNSLFDDPDEVKIIKEKKNLNKLKGIKDEPNLSVNLGTDKYGYDIWFYLQGLYKHTKHLSDNIGNMGGGGRRSKRGTIAPIEDILPKTSPAENIVQEREHKQGASTVSRVSDSAITSAVQEVLNSQKSGKTFIKLSKAAEEYKTMRDAAIATGTSYVKDEKLEKEIAEVEAKNEEIQKGYDKIAGGAIATTVKEFQTSLTSIIGSPARMISRYLNAATVSMNRMLFGDNGTGAKGFGETLREDLDSDFLKPLKDQLTRVFAPFRAIGSGIARVLFGIKDENGKYQGKFLSNFANMAGDAFKSFKEGAAKLFYKDDLEKIKTMRERRKRESTRQRPENEIYDDEYGYFDIEGTLEEDEEKSNNGRTVFDDIIEQMEHVDQAANGRKVTKTGLVAVSEGELIIPSELNPYYHKKTDKAQQIKNETNIVRKFWGSFAGGGTAEDISGETKKESITDKVKQSIDKTKDEGGILYNAYKGGEEIVSTLVKGAKETSERYFGTDKDFEKVKDSFLKIKDSIFADKQSRTDKLAHGAVGALVGGGAGLFLGAPMLGAMVGGATGIILKSKETQKVLFGEDKEDGEHKDGILPKKVADFIQGHVPSIGKGAAIGAGAGLFMGSPVMGALLGSAVGYINSSDAAKKLIFGEMKDGEREGGIIPKSVQQGIKKAYPNIAIGALGGALFGPLGLAGNIIMGSAVGYATSTDKFKKWLFGEEGEKGTPVGGFVSLLKENIANPIVDIFSSLTQSIKVTVRNTFHSLGKSLRKIVVRQFRIALSPFARAGKNILGKGAHLLEELIGGDKISVGRVLKGTAQRMQNRSLKNGNMIWDRENKQWLDAAGRNEWAKERGIDRGAYGAIDEYVSAEGRSVEDIRNLNKNIRMMIDPTKEFVKSETINKTDSLDISGQIRNDLKNAGKSDTLMRHIERDIRKNRYGDAFEKLKGARKEIGDDNYNRLFKKMEAAQDAYSKRKDIEKNGNDALLDILTPIYGEEMAKKMVKLNDNDLMKVLDNLKQDTKNMEFKTNDELSKEKQEEERKKLYDEVVVKTIPNTLLDIKDILLGKFDRAREATENDEKYQVDDPNKPREVYEKPTEEEIGDGTKEPELNSPLSKYDNDGNKLIFTNGEWRLDNTDSETRANIAKKNKVYEDIAHLRELPVIGGAVGGFAGTLVGLKDGILGNGKNKKGILTTIKEKLFGDGEDDNKGMLNKIFNFFAKPDFKNGFREFLGGANGLLVPAMWATAITGLFDHQFSTIVGSLGIFKGNDKTNAFSDEQAKRSADTGKEMALDENGNPIKDEEGRFLMTDGTYEDTYIKESGNSYTLSSQLKKNVATGLIMGNKSLANVAFNKGGQAISKMGSGLGKMFGIGSKKAAKGATSTAAEYFSKNATNSASAFMEASGKGVNFVDKAINALYNVADDLPALMSKMPIIGKYASKLGEFLQPVIKEAANVVSKSANKAVGLFSKIKEFMPLLKVVYIAGCVTNAWGNAESILGITEKATNTQRIIACIIAFVNASLPYIGNLIPNKTLVNIFMTVAPKVGFDVSSLAEQRAAAEQELAQWNEENPDNQYESIEQYNQANGRAGLLTKAKNGIKSAFSNVKEKGVKGIINTAANKVREGIAGVGSKAINGIANAASSVDEFLGISKMFELVKQGDIKGVMAYNAKNEDDTGLTGIAKNGINLITKQIAVPAATFFAVGKGVKKVFDVVANWGSDIGKFVKDEYEFGQRIVDGTDTEVGIVDYLRSVNPPKGPFQPVLHAVGGAARLLPLPILLVKALGRGIGKVVTSVAGGIKNQLISHKDLTMNSAEAMWQGDLVKLWSKTEYAGESTIMDGIFQATSIIPKLTFTVPTALMWVGRGIGKVIGGLAEKVRIHYSHANKYNEQLAQIAKEGDVDAVLNHEYEDDGENPIGWVFEHTNGISRWIYAASAWFHKTGNAIGEFFGSITGDISSDWNTVKEAQGTMKDAALKGDLAEILNTNFKRSEHNVIGGIHETIFDISKIFYGVYTGLEHAFGFFGEIFDKLKGKAVNKLQEWGVLDSEVVDENGNSSTKEGFLTKGKNFVNGIWNKGMNWLNGVDSSESAAGSGFVSQLDPRYAGVRLGNSTVAEMGCGPAAATMALNMRAKGSNMDDAINIARGYQTPQGTDASYFGDYYRSKGVDARYYSDSNDIYNSIAAGTPTVLMGRDSSNTSKRRSPFGPNNHYVVASGFDKNGRVIINDPEMKQPRSYSAEILNNVRMAVGMGSGINRRRRWLGLSAGGGSLRVDEVTQAVWGFLINNGFSEAAAAGIMGNMHAESGINPEAIQPNGDKAYGLCQWAGNRKTNLINYASSKGCDWTDLATQLEFLLEEIGGLNSYFNSNAEKYKSVSAFMNADDPAQAAVDFEKAFERAGKPVLEKRIEAALYYYQQFTGKTFDSPRAVQGSSTSSSNTSSISSTIGKIATGAAVASAFASEGSILDKIKNAFTSAFGMSALFGGLSSSNNSNSSGSTGDVNYNGNTISDNPIGSNFMPGASPVDYMKSIAGKIVYSMNGPRNPEKGSADCSSTVQWAINKATGIDIGNSTPAQYTDDDLSTVWYDGGKVAQSLPSNIQPNDVLFFSRPNSSFTNGRADRVGHVELYEGNGMMIGHPGPEGEAGPKERQVPIGEGDNGGLIKVMRLKPNASSIVARSGNVLSMAQSEMSNSAAGSGLMSYVDAHRDKLEAYSKKNVSDYNRYASKTRIPNRSIDKSAKAYIGRGAGASSIETSMSGAAVAKSSTGDGDKKAIALLVKTLIPLVETIVKNTNSIEGIYTLVSQLVQQGGGSLEDASKAIAMMSESMKSNKDIDSDLRELKDTVERILTS